MPLAAVAVGAIAAIAVGALALIAAPAAVPTVAARRGVVVSAARWCGDGICMEGLSREGIAVDRAVLAWDRSLSLAGARVSLDAARGGAGAAGGASWLSVIRVTDLTVPGTPLPALSGDLRPRVHLVGEGVTIDGETVSLVVPTPWGEVAAEVTGPRIRARCAACAITDATISATPVPLAVAFDGTWDDGRLVGTARAGGVAVEVDAVWSDGALAGTATLPPTPMADVVTLFDAIVPEARRARIDGTLAGAAVFRLPGGEVSFTPELSGFAVDGLLTAGLVQGPFTFWGRDAGDARVLLQSGEGSVDWVSLAGAGRWLPAAIIATEDARFREHAGWDIDQMLAAAGANAEAGRVVRGGSTLTQQLAKNLFLDGTRTYERKLRELLYAANLEGVLDKHRILELYVNVVEFGPGIRGAKAAARTYFLKSPTGLLPEEAAFLASILRNPRTAWRTQYLRGRPDVARVQWILDNMTALSPEERAAAKARGIHLVPP